MDTSLLIPAFIAGLLMFLAPCTLPLVPAYLGFISGVSAKDLQDRKKAKDARKKIFLNGLLFIVGFTLVFIFFGTLSGLVGRGLVFWRIWLSRIGGILIILFGLLALGILKISFLQRERRIKIPSFLNVGRPTTSLIVGATFAFGWTPCIGPVLGSILLLASTSATALWGGFLLFIFSVGLAVPFILIGLGFSKAAEYIGKISKYLRAVEIVGGIFLIFLGTLLLTDNFGLLVQYGYKIFYFINYEGILDYL